MASRQDNDGHYPVSKLIPSRNSTWRRQVFREVLVDLPTRPRPIPYGYRTVSAGLRSSQQPISAYEVGSTRRIRLNLKFTSAFRKHLYELRRHRHIRRFLRIFSNHVHPPPAGLGAKQEGGGELRAFR